MSKLSTKKARVEALRKISIFANLPAKDLQKLDQHATPTTIKAGVDIAHEGRAPKQFVLLVSGTATVRRNKRKLATLGAGDSVGELSLIDGGQQTATVTTDTECEALVVVASEFRSMLDDSPGFTRNLLKSTAQRLRAADEKLTA